ncbi:MAG: hypothetical protein ACI4P6_02260, partial [Candidatus Spyradosoma sp.]
MIDITPNANPRTLADSPVVTTGTDSDRSYTEYKWGFSGTAPYNENAFTRRIEGEILAERNLITIAVASDDAATGRLSGCAYGNVEFAYGRLAGTDLLSEIAVMGGYVMTKRVAYAA